MKTTGFLQFIIGSVSLNITFQVKKIRVYQQKHGATNVYDLFDTDNVTQFSIYWCNR